MKYRIVIKDTDKFSKKKPEVGEYYSHGICILYQRVDDSVASKILVDNTFFDRFIGLKINEEFIAPPSYCWTSIHLDFYILEIIGFDDKTKEVIFGVKKDSISFPIRITEKYNGVINEKGLKVECQTISHNKIEEIYELSKRITKTNNT